MRHVLYIIILAAISLFILGGCKARKATQKSSDLFISGTKIAQTANKEITTKTAGKDIRIEAKEDIWEYSRTEEIDTAGNVRRVQETWRGTGRTELALQRDSSRIISLNDLVSVTQEKDSVIEKSKENSMIENDSRPVQGVEWLWVVIGAGLLLILVLFFIKRSI